LNVVKTKIDDEYDDERKAKPSENPNPDLAICILFYEKADQTIDCIKSFLSANVNIYVLNNGSSSKSTSVLTDFCTSNEKIKIIHSVRNLGVAGGRNRLIENTKENWLLFVDNDIIIGTGDWLKIFNDYQTRFQQADVFVPRLFEKHMNRYAVHLSLAINNGIARCEIVSENRVMNIFPGGASFINRELFSRLGNYDEEMFIGFEDFEFALRAIQRKLPVKIIPIDEIELIHDHRKSILAEERMATIVRYDQDIIEASLKRLNEKHNIYLDIDWKVWTTNEENRILNGKFSARKSIWRNLIPKRIMELTSRTVDKITLQRTPKTCNIFMTAKCNLRCRVCSRFLLGIKEYNDMTLDTVKKLLLTYPSIDSFCVAGLGEPTLGFNFCEIVDFLKREGKYVGIITNGTVADKLLNLKFDPDYISISLYGFDEESYLENTGVKAFNKVVNTYNELRPRYQNVGFSFVVNRRNFHQISNILEFCDRMKPDFVDLINHLPYDPRNSDSIDKIIRITDSEIIRFIEETCRDRHYIRERPTYLDETRFEFLCSSYDCSINVDPHGNIGGCRRQISPSAEFGNIFKDSDPFNTMRIFELRRRIKSGSCPHLECNFCFGRMKK